MIRILSVLHGKGGIRQAVMLTSTAAIINMLFLFLETTIAARLVSTEAFGTYLLLVAVVNFLMMAVDFGARTAITQLIARDDGPDRALLVNSTIIFRIAVIVVVSIVVLVPSPLLQLFDPHGDLQPYVNQIPAMLFVASLDQLLFGILQGFQRYGALASAQVMRSTIRLALTVLFLGPLGAGIDGLLYSWTLSFAASALYQYCRLPIAKRLVLQRRMMTQLLRFGAPLQLSGVLWFIFGRIQTFLLGAWSGPTSVAYFGVASRIPDALQQVAESYMAVYFPKMTSLLATGQREQASRMLDTSLRLVSFCAAALALGSVMLSDVIINLLFSTRYAASAPAFSVLMVTLHMVLVVNLLGYTLTSAGHPHRSLIVDVVRTGVLVAGSLALIPTFGLMGAAYARLVSSYLGSPIVLRLLRRDTLPLSPWPCLRQTGILLVCAMLSLTTDSLIAKAIIGVLFLAASLALRTIRRDDLQLVMPMRQQPRPSQV